MRLIALLFIVCGLGLSPNPAPASTPAASDAAALVSGWAQHWQSQDFEGYAGLYSPQFSTPAFRDRQAWLSFRKPRVERPQSIEVRVYDLRVLEASTDRMLVEFVQFYASDRLRVYSLKKQVWTREADSWRIQAEEAVDLPKRHAVVREGLERPLAIAPAQPAPGASEVPPAQAAQAKPAPAAPAPPATPAEPPAALVSGVRFEGNLRVFTPQALAAVVQAQMGQVLTWQQMQALAGDVTRHYRDRGYVAAAALLPEQDLQGGLLRILVFEGEPDPRLPVRVEASPGLRLDTGWISRLMQSTLGSGPLEQARLERGLLLLSDIPGVKARVGLEPGDAPGTARAAVEMEEGAATGLVLGASNHGAKATGRHVLSVEGRLNNPLGHGEHLGLQYKPTDKGGQETWFLQSSLPVGADGWRLGVQAGQFSYQIDSEDEPNFFFGRASEVTLQAKWPWVRSRMRNRTVSVEATDKNMRDNRGVDRTEKGLSALSLGLSADTANPADGSSQWWSLMVTRGRLDLSPTPDNLSNDRDGLQTHGGYWRATVSGGAAWRLPEGFGLSASFQGQKASRNLNSSEKMSLGGPFGVRAYPVGEASGDEGLRAGLELRKALGTLAPLGDVAASVFYDWGRIVKQRFPLADSEQVNRFNLQGWGVGLVAAVSESHEFRLAWARKIGSNRGQILASDGETRVDNDGTKDKSRLWASVSFTF